GARAVGVFSFCFGAVVAHPGFSGRRGNPCFGLGGWVRRRARASGAPDDKLRETHRLRNRGRDGDFRFAQPTLQSPAQCRRNTPSTWRSSAGLISREWTTVTLNKGPSSFSCQKRRKSFSAGNFANRS